VTVTPEGTVDGPGDGHARRHRAAGLIAYVIASVVADGLGAAGHQDLFGARGVGQREEHDADNPNNRDAERHHAEFHNEPELTQKM
jgi:hypothetical protein